LAALGQHDPSAVVASKNPTGAEDPRAIDAGLRSEVLKPLAGPKPFQG